MKKITLFLTAFCFSAVALFGQINSNSPAKPFASNTSYSYGIMPTNLPAGVTYGKSQDAANAYNAWKSKFVVACSGKGSRVLFDDNSSTVSEGIAYGMLLSAYAGDKPTFDALWQFYKASVNGKGVMNWKYSNCTSVSGYNGATDAELDAAIALLVAEDQWPTATSPYEYKSEATSLISKIRQYEIHPTSYQTLNGDAWGTTNDCRNPSYVAPAYYRIYAATETSQASFWNSTVTASNSFLLTNRNSTTGLVGNWAGSNGVSNNCNGPNEYGFDACRNPWRMATDVLWNGGATATTAQDICTKISNWVKGNETNMKGPLAQNAANPSVGTYKNGTFSTYACAIMGTTSTNQNSLNTAYDAVVNLGNNDAYFGNTLRCLTLFMMTGNFWKPGSGGGVVLPATPVVTATDGSSCDNSTVSWGAVSGATSYKVYKNGTLQTTQTTTSYVDANAPAIDASVAQAGYSATGCKDDFNSSKDYALGATGKGLFWWAPKGADLGKYTLTRDSANKKLTVAINQPKGSYTPFGVSFGDDIGDGTGVPYTADMSANFTYKMTITNNSAVDVLVRLAAQDATANVLDLNSSPTVAADAWKYNIDAIITAGGSKTLEVGTLNSQSIALSGTFIGAATADWSTTPPTIKTTFDRTKVKGFNITVLSTQQDPVTYAPLALTGSIAVTAFQVGNYVSGTTGTPAEYCVEACSANGCSAKGCDNGYKKICTVTIPTAPASLTATDGTSCDNVSLSWSASSGATSYNVYRGTTLLGNVATTTYTDAAAPTTATNYCVEAKNSAGTSAQTCNTGYKGTNCGSLPSAPTGVSATDGTICTGSTISWSAVSTATSYNVYKDGVLLSNTTSTSIEDPDAPVSDGSTGGTTTAGYSTTGCLDDFASETDYALGTTGKGLFWWKPADAPGIYTLTRNSTAKQLDVAIDQPAGSFKPFGVSFGDSNGDGTGTPYTADMSGDFTYNMTVVNNSAVDVFIRLAAQDVAGNTLDLNSSPTPAGDAWKYNVDMLVGAGSSKTLKVGTLNSQSVALSGTFVGAAFADWSTTPPTIKTTFDRTKVKGFNITVLSTQQDPVTYAPLALTGSISITAFDMGNFVPTTSTSTPPANYCVEAVNSYGSSTQACNTGYKGTGCTTNPPAMPTGVSATDGTSTTGVTISWNAVSTATSYKVYKAGTLLTTVTTTSYTDVAASTTATQYCVEAINADGASAQACDNGYKGTAGTAPTAPTGVIATDGTISTGVTISWNTVATATSYNVYKAGTLLTSVTTTNYTDAAASTSSTEYCVEALNTYGTSAQTCDNGYKGSTTTAPSTPTGVNATDGTICTSSTITWNAVANATSYKVYKDGTLLGSTTTTSMEDLNAPESDGSTGGTTTAGYSTTGCLDDFASETDYALGTTGKGLFWWKPADAPGIYTLTRNSTAKQLDVAIDQPAGSFKPFGVSFGDSNGDGTGTPYTADMSGDFTYNMTVVNSSAVDVFIRLAAQDVAGNTLDLNSSPTPAGDAWKYNVDMLVGAGSSKTLKVGTLNSQSIALSGTFVGAAFADWSTTPPTIKTTFDRTQVKGFNITVLSTQQDPVTYAPLALTGSISITAFDMGNFVPTTTTSTPPANYCVEAVNSVGTSAQACNTGYKGTGCTTNPPTTPTGVSATDGTSTTSVTISWNAVANATSYKVYKAGSLLTTLTTTSYTDAAASTTATQYCVEAINADGTSAQACDNGYKGTSGTAPTTPTGVNATDGTVCTGSTISWNAVAGATSYKIYKDGSLLTTTTTTSYVDANAPISDGTSGTTTTAGYSATGCIDDFASETDYALGTTGKGLFWWKPADAPGIYTLTRNTAANKLDVAVDQPAGSFKPFGVSFGDSNGDGTGTPYTADMSGDFTYNMTVVNNSAVDVFVRLAAQDAAGNTLDLNSSPTPAGDAWKYNVDMLVGAGSSKTLKVGTLNSQSVALSGTFVGAAFADWSTTPPTIKTTFDRTKVKGFNITVLSTQQDPVTYAPLALTGSISITSFDMGNFVPSTVGGGATANYCVEAINSYGTSSQACNDGYKTVCQSIVAEAKSDDNVTVYPNPASSFLKVEGVLSGSVVKVYDILGQQVINTLVSDPANVLLNTADLKTGIYFLTSQSENKEIITRKFIKK